MLGHGKVPWPFVRRSRFVRELEQQGAAYRQNVAAADGARWDAERALELAEREFTTTVNKLAGWTCGTEQHYIADAKPDEVAHFRMELVPEAHSRSWSFVFRMSDSMMMQMMKTLNPVEAKHLIRTVTDRLTTEVLGHMYEEGGRF